MYSVGDIVLGRASKTTYRILSVTLTPPSYRGERILSNDLVEYPIGKVNQLWEDQISLVKSSAYLPKQYRLEFNLYPTTPLVK